MPKFGRRSLGNLSECHPDLQVLAREAIKLIDFTIIEGYRGKEEQDRAFFKKHSKLRFPQSKHNQTPSLAFDIIPYPFNGWENREDFYYRAGFILAVARQLYEQGKITHIVRWGGDWDRDDDLYDQTFMDLPHFELVKP